MHFSPEIEMTEFDQSLVLDKVHSTSIDLLEQPDNNGYPQLPPTVHPTQTSLLKENAKKPPYSYVALIALAIESATDRRMTVAQIYRFIEDNFAFYRLKQGKARHSWQNSIRHNLSLNQCFHKVQGDGARGHKDKKGNFWTLTVPLERMFEPGNWKRRKRMNRQSKSVCTNDQWQMVQQPCLFQAQHHNPADHVYQVPPNVVLPQVQCPVPIIGTSGMAGYPVQPGRPFYLTAMAAASLAQSPNFVNADPTSLLYSPENAFSVPPQAASHQLVPGHHVYGGGPAFV